MRLISVHIKSVISHIGHYGVSTWAPSTFDGHTALISNYIKPIIGDVKLDDITPGFSLNFIKISKL